MILHKFSEINLVTKLHIKKNVIISKRFKKFRLGMEWKNKS